MARYRVAAEGDIVEGWTSCTASEPSSGTDPCRDARAAIRHVLTEIVGSDHLVLLTGLGTSLAILEADGKTPKFPTMAMLWNLVAAKTGATFDQIRSAVNYSASPKPSDSETATPAPGENIEELLSRCQMAQELGLTKAGLDMPEFIKTAEGVIRGQCAYQPTSSETQIHEDFLRRIVRRGSRKARASLFTTNYDRCFETAAARMGLPLIDGFSFTQPPRFSPETFDYDIVTHSTYSKEPDYVPRLLRFFKLHGSVDWERTSDGVERRENPENPLLIYPRYGKYEASYAPPFLEMMSRFQSNLRSRGIGVLVVCFGFNDLHIAEPILSAVRSNTTLRMAVVAPDLCSKDADAVYGKKGLPGTAQGNLNIAQLNQLIDRGDNRLTLINAKFSEITQLMPLLPMQSETEQQETRIKELEAWVAKQRPPAGDSF